MEGIDIKFLRFPFGIDARDSQTVGEAGYGELSVGDKVVDENGELVTLDETYFDADHPEKLEKLLSQHGNKIEIAAAEDTAYLLFKSTARFANNAGVLTPENRGQFFETPLPTATNTAPTPDVTFLHSAEYIFEITNQGSDVMTITSSYRIQSASQFGAQIRASGAKLDAKFNDGTVTAQDVADLNSLYHQAR